MIVRLTHDQYRTVSNRVPELHREAMALNWSKYGRGSREFELPAIAWRQILDHLVATCFGPMGGKLDRMPQSVYSAIGRIQQVVMRMEHHPALRHAAVAGWLGEIVPAWRSGPNFWCYPLDAGFVLLIPNMTENRGMKITTWAPGELGSEAERPCYSPVFNDFFLGETFLSSK